MEVTPETVQRLRSLIVSAARVASSRFMPAFHVNWNYGMLRGLCDAARILDLTLDEVGLAAWPHGSREDWMAACVEEQNRQAQRDGPEI